MTSRRAAVVTTPNSAPGRRDASAKTMGCRREESALIEFLVLAHLTMSHIAQKEDLSDPEVIDAFAKLVGTSGA